MSMNYEVTEEHEAHITELATNFITLLGPKYRQGVKEHGGHINDMTPLQLIEESIKENVDQFVYLWSARQKLLGIL